MLSGYAASVPREPRTRNRGPAAAAENRRAILDAARRVFAQRGYHAPLSAVAKEAGVGQGVLYRHFPDRLSLALEVFERNWAAYEELAVDPDPRSFHRLWTLMIEHTITDAAFVEMAVDARRSLVDYDGAHRQRALIEPSLRRAQDAGLIDPELTAADVILGARMAFGIVTTADEGDDVRAMVARALRVARLLPPID